MSQDDDLPLIWWSASRLSPYGPLGPTEIRLVEILPGKFDDPIEIAIRPVDLSTHPTYDALSYAWNPDNGTIEEDSPLVLATVRNCDDFSVQLGPNLSLAIRYLRKEDCSRTMWIDEHVRVWLGPPHYDHSLALTTVSPNAHIWGDHVLLIKEVEWLLRRSWFNRLWVAQEVALSRKDPIVHCGHDVIDWSSFEHAVQNSRTFSLVVGKQNKKPRQEFAYLVNNFERLAMMRESSLKGSFSEILLWSSHLKASDTRDKVFGILGICNSDQNFSIKSDYTKSVNRVYAEAAAQIMRERLDIYVGY